MDTHTWMRIEAVFFDALERPEDERAAFLDAACAGDPELRREVEAMLGVHQDGSGLKVERVLLDTAARAGAPPREPLPDRAGERVGPWRLERLLGQGGMGEVWLGARADGEYEQHAAVKLVRPGWRAAQLVPRFRRERQVLARLQHPNIATLLDGGLTADGFPYLAMEYVDGRPVTAWCTDTRASLRDRLALFRTICETVRFAHANLVVHRDLKPQNILVTADGRPVLLDFGIATLLDPEDDSHPLTRDEDRVLTPEHAAPEQLRGQAATTATDVWALGVLLYELLSGARPFTGRDCTPLELERRVLHDEPPPPSAAAIPRERARALRGDLDRIVMKALRKEPGRRYRSAEDFGEDVGRWLDGLPVNATPDSLGYRSGKFLRRHRAALGAAGLVAALVMAFGVTSARQARHIAKERDAAISARRDSDAAVTMLVDMFRLGNPGRTPGADSLKVDDLVRRAEEKLRESTESPRVRTKLWRTLAELHQSRSHFEAQGAALERAMEAARQAGDETDLLAVFHEQARFVLDRDGAKAAEPLLRESVSRHEALLPASEDLAAALQDLASVVDGDERTRFLEQSMTIRRTIAAGGAGEDSVGLAAGLNALGAAHFTSGQGREALAEFRQSRDILHSIDPEHPALGSLDGNIATTLQSLGRYEEAEAIHRRLLEKARRTYGDGSAWVANSLDNLGVCLANEGRHDEATVALREAVDIALKTHGPAHRTTSAFRSDLGIALVRAGRSAEGLAQYDSSWTALDRSGASAMAVERYRVSRLRLELVAGLPVAVDTARAICRQVRGDPDDRGELLMLALQVLGTAALATPAEADSGEAEAAFGEVLRLARRLDEPMSGAAARCGLEVARAQAGKRVDMAGLKEALGTCGSWGMADPRVVAAARALVDRTAKSPFAR